MIAVKYLWFLFAVGTCNVYNDCEIACERDDEACFKQGAAKLIQPVVSGGQHHNKRLDPLSIKVIDGKQESTNYKLTNIELKGLLSCEVTKLNLDWTKSVFVHHLHCPELISKFNLETKGASDSGQNNRKGLEIKAGSFKIQNTGNFFVFNDDGVVSELLSKPIDSEVDIQDIQSDDVKDDKTAKFLFSLIVKKAMKILMDRTSEYCQLAYNIEISDRDNSDIIFLVRDFSSSV